MTIGPKCAHTQKPKYWTPPFFTDNYNKNQEVQNPEKWLQYGQLTHKLKRMLFDSAGNDAQNFLFSFAAPRQRSEVYFLNLDIVEVIIAQQLFHPEDANGASHERAMASFKRNMYASEDVGSSNRVSEYTVTISNPLQFRMVVRFMASGISFRQCCSVLESAKTETGMAAIGSCQVKEVAKRARF